MNYSSSRRDRQFEEYLRDGISAAKAGNHKLAQSLLNRAILMNGGDARPYIWLSATTQDPQEQIEYLEKAVAMDPFNARARRGLAILTGKIDKSQLVSDRHNSQNNPSAETTASQGRAVQCPHCGGRLAYSVEKQSVCCEYCGYVREDVPDQSPHSVADSSEQILDFVMPTAQAHYWVLGQQRLSCESCGAVSILPKAQKSQRCPYCGSNQLADSKELRELVDPQVISLMKIGRKEAHKRIKKWMGRGLFSHDNLITASKGLKLNPAYYSCWTFDGISEINWSCEVQVNNTGYERWEPRYGVQSQVFNDILVSGVQAISEKDLSSIGPFDLVNVEKFSPEYLAGWPTILYDCSISDASNKAREIVARRFRPQVNNLIEIGREKRNVQISFGKWADMTYKHILLPIWVGNYTFQGKSYRVLMNGQTGKIRGEKPRDSVKLIFGTLTAVMFVFLLFVLYLVITGTELPF